MKLPLVFTAIIFLSIPTLAFAESSLPPLRSDHLVHKARDLETQDTEVAPPQRTEPRARAGNIRPQGAPDGAAPVNHESETIHFYNGTTILKQGLGSIPEGTTLSIVNGSGVTQPVIHSRKTVFLNSDSQI